MSHSLASASTELLMRTMMILCMTSCRGEGVYSHRLQRLHAHDDDGDKCCHPPPPPSFLHSLSPPPPPPPPPLSPPSHLGFGISVDPDHTRHALKEFQVMAVTSHFRRKWRVFALSRPVTCHVTDVTHSGGQPASAAARGAAR